MKRRTNNSNRHRMLRKRFISAFSAALLALVIMYPAPVYSFAKTSVREVRSCVLSIVDIKDQIVSISPADFYPAF